MGITHVYSFKLEQPLNTLADKEEFRAKVQDDLSNIDLDAISWNDDLERPDEFRCTFDTDMYCQPFRDQNPATSMSVEYYNYLGENRDLGAQILRVVRQHIPGARCASHPVIN